MPRRPRDPEGYALGDAQSQKVAAVVRELLTARGLTQTALSKATEIPQSHISDLVSATTDIPRRRRFQRWHIQKIAAALGVEERDLVGTIDVAPEAERPTLATVPPAAQKLSGSPARLPPGLSGFLERHSTRERITRRERWYLENSRFAVEPWVKFDDSFWLGQLKFWRLYLAEQDAAGGGPSQEDT